MIVPPDAENRTIVSSFVWTKHGNVTDGQTNRQTDRIALPSTAVCINADGRAEKITLKAPHNNRVACPPGPCK